MKRGISLALAVLLMLLLAGASPGEASKDESRTPMPYSRVYEPETSWSMSATVAWEADPSVFSAAGKTRRPGTAIVYPTASLAIEDRNGNLIAETVDEYVAKTAGTIIPAFYLQNRETAAALKSWLERHGLQDCFVAALPALKDAVGEVARRCGSGQGGGASGRRAPDDLAVQGRPDAGRGKLRKLLYVFRTVHSENRRPFAGSENGGPVRAPFVRDSFSRTILL